LRRRDLAAHNSGEVEVNSKRMKVGNWLWAGMAAILLLAGCGGGGGGGGGGGTTMVADVRNGEYTAFAADGHQYALTLSFNAMTYTVSGNSVNASGSFAAEGSGYVFLPAPTGAVRNNARFSLSNDTVIGGFQSGSGVVPFVAPRSFVTTVTDAVGTYNFLAREVDPPAASNNAIFSGEITAARELRYCFNSQVYTIAACPAATIRSGPLTVSGSEFAAATPDGTIRFRVARIGSDKVVLRASASTGTSRRFWVGTPAVAYTPGTFGVVNTLGEAGTSTVSLSAHASTLVASNGIAVNFSSSVNSAALPVGLLGMVSPERGNFFAICAADMAVIVAARDNPTVPGLFQMGRP
jgi:hypothetical protein